MRKLRMFGGIMGLVGLVAGSAQAMSVGYVEDFNGGGANWRQNSSAVDVDWAATGGPLGAGDGYATYDRNMGTSTGVQVIFRGHDAFNASGDAFVGNWVDENIHEFSFWFLHDAPAPLQVGVRFAKAANSPAISIYAPEAIDPNVWTEVSLWIDAANPGWLLEGPGSNFNNVFSALGNIQVFAQRNASVPENTTVTFGIDKVTAVPEPATLALLGVGGLAALRRRSRGKVKG